MFSFITDSHCLSVSFPSQDLYRDHNKLMILLSSSSALWLGRYWTWMCLGQSYKIMPSRWIHHGGWKDSSAFKSTYSSYRRPITHHPHKAFHNHQSSGWIWYLWPLSAPTLTYLPSYIHITRNTKNPLKKIWVNLGMYTRVCFLHEFKEEKNKKDKVTLLSQILLKSKSYMSPSTTCKEIFPVQQWNWSQSIVLPTRLGFYVWGMGCFHFLSVLSGLG